MVQSSSQTLVVCVFVSVRTAAAAAAVSGCCLLTLCESHTVSKAWLCV
jgi:hypothetical protein